MVPNGKMITNENNPYPSSIKITKLQIIPSSKYKEKGKSLTT